MITCKTKRWNFCRTFAKLFYFTCNDGFTYVWQVSCSSYEIFFLRLKVFFFSQTNQWLNQKLVIAMPTLSQTCLAIQIQQNSSEYGESWDRLKRMLQKYDLWRRSKVAHSNEDDDARHLWWIFVKSHCKREFTRFIWRMSNSTNDQPQTKLINLGRESASRLLLSLPNNNSII